MAKKKQLKQIQTRLLSRGLSMARTTFRVGAAAAQQAIKDVLTPTGQEPRNYQRYLYSQIEVLTEELGQLKGSVMKVGQLLSTYGEHFLPKEANELLKSLQFQSPTLAWPAIEKVLLRELGRERMQELEIDEQPLAAASIGQVHRARRRSDGRELAIKIQYPGVDSAIETDLKFLKTILSIGPFLTKGPRFDQIFDEVRLMLHQEVDYRHELRFTQDFAKRLAGDPRYRVPEVFPELSTQRILTTEYLMGATVDGPEVAALSLARRNEIGKAYLDLYLRELVEFRAVQTDPHLGNYRIEIGAEHDRLILFDFGAVRRVPDEFYANYVRVMAGGLKQRPDWVEQGGRNLKLLLPDDPSDLIERYCKLCYLITEPFADPAWNFAPQALMDSLGQYDWGASDLPKRVAKAGAEIVFGFSLRSPPQETIFLDRKMGGAFVFLSVLGCQMRTREMLLSRLEAHL